MPVIVAYFAKYMHLALRNWKALKSVKGNTNRHSESTHKKEIKIRLEDKCEKKAKGVHSGKGETYYWASLILSHKYQSGEIVHWSRGAHCPLFFQVNQLRVTTVRVSIYSRP